MMGARAERWLAAILVGDVACYNRMMGADEEGTLLWLNAHRREFWNPKSPSIDWRGGRHEHR